jgi:hypothetical protein
MPVQTQHYINDATTVFGNNGGVTPAAGNTVIVTTATLGPGNYEVEVVFTYTGATGAADTVSNVKFSLVPNTGATVDNTLIVSTVASTITPLLFPHVTIRGDMVNATFKVRSVAAGTTAIYNALLVYTQIPD